MITIHTFTQGHVVLGCEGKLKSRSFRRTPFCPLNQSLDNAYMDHSKPPSIAQQHGWWTPGMGQVNCANDLSQVCQYLVSFLAPNRNSIDQTLLQLYFLCEILISSVLKADHWKPIQ